VEGPGGFPGSHEYLLFCADLGSGLVPIHTNGVHLNDESWGMPPRWSISATIQSNPRLLSLLNDGQIPPSSCNAQPIWGNQSDFRFASIRSRRRSKNKPGVACATPGRFGSV
jgi:hypothetical protein